LKNNELTSKLNSINDEETMNSIQKSSKAVTQISSDMKNVQQEAIDMNNDIYKLKLKLAGLEPEWDSKFGLAEENISQSERNIKMSKQEIGIAETRMHEHHEKFQAWNSSFSSKLQELRDKIARAKHAADGVRKFKILTF
jgi:laminin alpha 1/2